ncbi:hypothetical protein STEG23_029026 [Scotinomys teguina]
MKGSLLLVQRKIARTIELQETIDKEASKFQKIQCNWFYIEVLIHLDLSFVHGNRYGSICYLLHIEI